MNFIANGTLGGNSNAAYDKKLVNSSDILNNISGSTISNTITRYVKESDRSICHGAAFYESITYGTGVINKLGSTNRYITYDNVIPYVYEFDLGDFPYVSGQVYVDGGGSQTLYCAPLTLSFVMNGTAMFSRLSINENMHLDLFDYGQNVSTISGYDRDWYLTESWTSTSRDGGSIFGRIELYFFINKYSSFLSGAIHSDGSNLDFNSYSYSYSYSSGSDYYIKFQVDMFQWDKCGLVLNNNEIYDGRVNGQGSTVDSEQIIFDDLLSRYVKSIYLLQPNEGDIILRTKTYPGNIWPGTTFGDMIIYTIPASGTEEFIEKDIIHINAIHIFLIPHQDWLSVNSHINLVRSYKNLYYSVCTSDGFDVVPIYVNNQYAPQIHEYHSTSLSQYNQIALTTSYNVGNIKDPLNYYY